MAVALRWPTHVAELVVYVTPHLGYPPLDDVAERLVVDVEVLTADRALCSLLEFILPVSVCKSHGRLWSQERGCGTKDADMRKTNARDKYIDRSLRNLTAYIRTSL